MYEIARFQRLSRVSAAASGFHGPAGDAVRIERAPRQPVEARIGRESRRDALEQARGIDAVVVRECDHVGLEPCRAPTLRARERPGRRAQAHDSSARGARRARRRPGRRRSGRRRGHVATGVWLSSEPRSRSSSLVRPPVATTRSNDGSSRDTRRRLRDACADRPARLRARRRRRRRAVSSGTRSRASCARRSPTSSSSSSTTARSTGRRPSSRTSATPACACCGTRRAQGLASVAEPRARRGARAIRRAHGRRRRGASRPGSSARWRSLGDGRLRSSAAASSTSTSADGLASVHVLESGRRGDALARPLQLARASTTRSWSSATSSSGTGSATTPPIGESEDYDLWTRVLEHTEGDSVDEPLVLHRAARGAGFEAARRPTAHARAADLAARDREARSVALGRAGGARALGRARARDPR